MATHMKECEVLYENGNTKKKRKRKRNILEGDTHWLGRQRPGQRRTWTRLALPVGPGSIAMAQERPRPV